MPAVRYILFDKGFLPVHQDKAVPYLRLRELPESLRVYIADWQRSRNATEKGADGLPANAVTEFALLSFLIEKNMTSLI